MRAVRSARVAVRRLALTANPVAVRRVGLAGLLLVTALAQPAPRPSDRARRAADRRLLGAQTPSNSTSNLSVALGGITPPAP